jgi:hypothetical protein
VRDSLKGAAVAGVLSVPAPTVYDLPPSLQLASFRLGVSADMWVVRPGCRTDSGPPAPHAVVRTVVMRILEGWPTVMARMLGCRRARSAQASTRGLCPFSFSQIYYVPVILCFSLFLSG